MTAKKEIEHFNLLIRSAQAAWNGAMPQALLDIRRQAGAWFVENGFPGARDEEWRFTDLSPIRNTEFKLLIETPKLTSTDLEPLLFESAWPRLVFVNGRFDAALSSQTLPKQVRLMSLKEAAASQPMVAEQLARRGDFRHNGFAALNTALMEDGAFLHVAAGAVIEQPLLLLFVAVPTAVPTAVFPRNLVIVGENAQASFIEHYVTLGAGAHFTDAVTEVAVRQGAVVEHYKLQQENDETFHTALLQVEQARGSVYTSHNHAFGGSLVRNDLNIVLNGEGAEATLNGLYLTGGTQLVDNHSVIEHAKPHCNSRELYKGILDDRSRAVFSGKIHVHKDAQKTDAIQSNQNLLLSDDATVDTKPQLEIYADDVRCTHGATVGQLDENGIFYLRARGISKENAHLLMIHAFAGEVVEAIKLEALRKQVTQLVNERLQNGVESA